MTATLHVLPVDRPPQAPAPAPKPHPGAEFPMLRDALLAQLHRPGTRLIVDLTAVGFFGAAGLAELATARQATLAAGIGLGLVANTRPVLLPGRMTP